MPAKPTRSCPSGTGPSKDFLRSLRCRDPSTPSAPRPYPHSSIHSIVSRSAPRASSSRQSVDQSVCSRRESLPTKGQGKKEDPIVISDSDNEDEIETFETSQESMAKGNRQDGRRAKDSTRPVEKEKGAKNLISSNGRKAPSMQRSTDSPTKRPKLSTETSNVLDLYHEEARRKFLSKLYAQRSPSKPSSQQPRIRRLPIRSRLDRERQTAIPASRSSRRSTGAAAEPIDLRSESISSSSSGDVRVPTTSVPLSQTKSTVRSSAFGSHGKGPKLPPTTIAPTSRISQTSPSRRDASLGSAKGRRVTDDKPDTPAELATPPNMLTRSESSSSFRHSRHFSVPSPSQHLFSRSPTPLAAPNRVDNNDSLARRDKDLLQRVRAERREPKRFEGDGNYRPRSRNRSTALPPIFQSRLTRQRLKPGGYTLPAIDTPIDLWPSQKSSQTDKGRATARDTNVHVSQTGRIVTARTDRTPINLLRHSRGRPTTRDNIPSNRSLSSSLTPLSITAIPSSGKSLLGPSLDESPPNLPKDEEEAEEKVEEKRTLEPVDILAQFEDYDFSATSPVVKSQQSRPATPQSGTGSYSRVSSVLADKPNEQLSPFRPPPSPTSLKHLASPIKAARRPTDWDRSQGASPRKPIPISSASGGPVDKVLSILSHATASRGHAITKAQEEQAARKRRIEALEDSDEADEELEDPMDLLLSPASSPRQVVAESNRRSTRVCTFSALTTSSDRSQPPAKPRKSVASGLDRLIAQEKRDRRRGIDSDAAERVLESLRLTSPRKGGDDNPYPTPDSEREPSPEPRHAVEQDLSMDDFGKVMLDDLAIGAMLEDAKRSRREEGASFSRRSAAKVEWEGFWEGPESLKPVKLEMPSLSLVGGDEVIVLIRQAADNVDLSLLSSLLTSGLSESILRTPENVVSLADYLLLLSLGSSNLVSNTMAAGLLLDLVFRAPSHPFENSMNLFAALHTILRSLGARCSSIGPSFVPDRSLLALSDRSRTVGLLCALIKSSVGMGWLLSAQACTVAQILLLLAIDSWTSPLLRRTIDDTLLSLWPLCLSEATAVDLAMGFCSALAFQPLLIQVEVPLVVGQRSEEAREISRWTAIGMLLPGCLQSLKPETVHIIPEVGLLLEAARTIYDMLVGKAPDHEAIADRITLLSEAATDIDVLVEITPIPTDIEDLRDILRKSVNRIQARASHSLEGQNRARLLQLNDVLRMQLEVAVKRRTRRERTAMKGIALIEGEGGQTTLSFGLKGVD